MSSTKLPYIQLWRYPRCRTTLLCLFSFPSDLSLVPLPQSEVREELARINAYDLRLFDYAQSLMAYRLKLITPIVNDVKRDLGLNAHRNTVNANQLKEARNSGVCRDMEHTLTVEQKKNIGIFRPPGHKGPLWRYANKVIVIKQQLCFRMTPWWLDGRIEGDYCLHGVPTAYRNVTCLLLEWWLIILLIQLRAGSGFLHL